MMETNSIGHVEFAEMIAAYVAGGLEGRDRAAFEAHAAICAACAAALEQAVRIDRRLEQLFGASRPAAGLEDRVVRRLREERPRRTLIHPAVWRATGGIAAALVLGAVGFAANRVMERGQLPLPAFLSPASGEAANELAYRFDGEKTGKTSSRFGLGYGEGGGEISNDFSPTADDVARQYITDAREKANASTELWGEFQEGRGEVWRRGRVPESGMNAPPTEAKPAAPSTNAPSDASVVTKYETEAGKDLRHYYALNLSSAGGGQQAGAPQLGDVTMAAGLDGTVAAAAGESAPAHFGSASKRGGATRALGAMGIQPGGGGGFGAGGAGGAGKALADQQGQGVPADMKVAQPETPAFFKPADLSQVVRDVEKAGESRDGVDELRKQRGDVEGKAVEFQQVPENAPLAALVQNQAASQDPQQPSKRPENPAPSQVTPTAPPPPTVQEQSVLANRKIIRNGEMEFEVDGFDSSFVQITKIVGEEGGFVSSTNSEKLPNGKVRGTIVLRVPPERLDTLVLKLRALGDLKSQRISAQDVTKVYYDLESELKAARAMEERLLSIIKSGKGEIKDLLEAEKQLGVYRSQIEKLEGEIRYYNNLVSLSTLSITLYERDLKQAGLAAQTEQVNAGIETEDVEKSRAEAIKAIEEAKGRIVESNLKKYDAGQLGALIVADVAPDASGPLIDRMKQLGRVARLDIERKQTTPTGTAPLPQARLERRDTRFSISIYNLANIAPRQMTNMSMAVANVEEAYRSILEAVRGRNGRIVTSSLNRQKPEQTTATVSFEVPSADADATLLEIRREREVMALTVTENPDTNNVTGAKRGFSVQIVSLATVPSRETEQQVLATRQNVAETFRSMLEELKKVEARILVSQLNQQDQNNVSGQLDFEVVRGREAELRSALAPFSDVISRTVTRSSDVENTVDSKVRIQVRLLSIDQLAPRVTQNLGMAVKDVPTAYRDIIATLTEIGSRILTSQLNEQDPQNITGTLDFDVLRENIERADKALASAGVVYSRAVTRSADTQNTVDMKVRMQVSLRNVEQLPPRETARVMLETSDVDKSRGELIAASDAAGGRTVQDTQAIASNGEVSSHLVIEVPLSRAPEIRQQIKNAGTLRVSESTRDPQAPDGTVGRARFDITLTSPGLLVGRDEGLAATIKSALSTSLKGLLWSLNFILIGLLFVGPWVLLLWLAWRVIRRNKTKPAAVPATA